MGKRLELEKMQLKTAKAYLRDGDYEIIKIKRKWGKKIVITIKETKKNGNLGNNQGKLV